MGGPEQWATHLLLSVNRPVLDWHPDPVDARIRTWREPVLIAASLAGVSFRERHLTWVMIVTMLSAHQVDLERLDSGVRYASERAVQCRTRRPSERLMVRSLIGLLPVRR